FASFSGRTEKEGPARPERGPIFSSLVTAIRKASIIYRNFILVPFDEMIMHPISARGTWVSTSGAIRLLHHVVESEFDGMHLLNSRLFIK
uniref:hypothetical protein n=1 Tax=Candidatus Fimivicinus sp. TaxID=3056640 RepID=UPI003FEF3921